MRWTHLSLLVDGDWNVLPFLIQLLHLQPELHPPHQLAPAGVGVVAAEAQVEAHPAQIRVGDGVPENMVL